MAGPREVRVNLFRGAWVAQSVKPLTSAQVIVSQFMSLNPASGSVLTTQGLELPSDSVSPSLSLSAPPLLVRVLFLCLSLKNQLKKKKERVNLFKTDSLLPGLPERELALLQGPLKLASAQCSGLPVPVGGEGVKSYIIQWGWTGAILT